MSRRRGHRHVPVNMERSVMPVIFRHIGGGIVPVVQLWRDGNVVVEIVPAIGPDRGRSIVSVAPRETFEAVFRHFIEWKGRSTRFETEGREEEIRLALVDPARRDDRFLKNMVPLVALCLANVLTRNRNWIRRAGLVIHPDTSLRWQRRGMLDGALVKTLLETLPVGQAQKLAQKIYTAAPIMVERTARWAESVAVRNERVVSPDNGLVFDDAARAAAAPSRPANARPVAIGASCFAGGFTWGVHRHFDVVAHLEERFPADNGKLCAYAVDTHRENFPETRTYPGNDWWPIEDLRRDYPDLGFVYGNPPCKAFSSMGRRKGEGSDRWRKDPSIGVIRRHLDLMRRLRPKAWAWESVTEAYTTGKELCREFESEALALGYSVSYLLHDARWHGVAQKRERFFMLCHRVEVDVPAPNWAPPPTVGEVLAMITPRGRPYDSNVPAALKDKFHLLEPGDQLRNLFDRLFPDAKRNERSVVRGRPSFGVYRLRAEEPAPAIVGKGAIHPSEDRCLTINELQALAGFPDDWRWAPGNANAQAREMSRGVAPPVGEWLALIVATAIAEGREVTTPTVREVDHRKPPRAYGNSRCDGRIPVTAFSGETTRTT
jgi:site-specific DNA-cytosine methylase